MNILEKIQSLITSYLARKGDAQDIATLEGWYSEAKRLLLLKSLKDHDGIKYLLQVYKGEVDQINLRLSREDSKTLPDKYRDRLLDRRDLAQKYLDLLMPVDYDLEKLEEAVDREQS